MGDISIFNGVINQKQSPALYQGNFANRPTANFLGRMFTSVDTGQIFVDTGSTWVLVADAGVGGGTLSSVCVNGNTTATGIVITAGGLNTNAITNTSNTAGSVLFAGTGGIESQSNSTFFWDNTNKRLGIGNAAPGAPLDVHGTGTQIQINGTGSNNSFIQFQNAGVSKWREGNLYNAGSNDFQIYNNSLAAAAMTLTGSTSNATFTGTLTASSLIKSGGTSTQFLKADGSVDSSAYITLASLSATSPLIYNNLTGAFTIQVANASQSGYLSSTDWTTFNNKASLGSFSASTPLSYNSGTGAFSIQVANSGQSGYLTSTDWNTFNNKQNTITTGNLTEATSSVLTITGGTGSVIGSGTTIAVKQSSSTQSGYLSSTDWNTFNNKAAALNGTGFVKASGTVISYDNSTYYLASNPSNYITLTSLAATSPLVYNNLSGGFSITQATTSTNGYLSSTDWNTFNNKQSALTNPITGTGTTNYHAKFTGSTTIGNSLIWDNGTNVGIGNTNTSYTLDVSGTGRFSGQLTTYQANSGLNALDVSHVNGNAIKVNASYNYYDAYEHTFRSLNGTSTYLTIANTGAATFSSSVTAGGDITIPNGNYYYAKRNTGGSAIGVIGFAAGSDTLTIKGGTSGAAISMQFQDTAGTVMSLYNGNVLIGTTTDNGNGKLQVNGNLTANGISIAGTQYTSSSTLTYGYYHVFTGGSGQTLTLNSPSSNNFQYVIINNTSNTLTIAAASTCLIVNLSGSGVSSITLAANARCFIVADGGFKYYQIF